jgi:hypothetical protein
MVWIELMLLRIGTRGGRLWARYWTFGFHKMLGSSWVAAQLATSEEGLSAPLVSKYVSVGKFCSFGRRTADSCHTDMLKLKETIRYAAGSVCISPMKMTHFESWKLVTKEIWKVFWWRIGLWCTWSGTSRRVKAAEYFELEARLGYHYTTNSS